MEIFVVLPSKTEHLSCSGLNLVAIIPMVENRRSGLLWPALSRWSHGYPAATNTNRKVPQVTAKTRRHSKE